MFNDNDWPKADGKLRSGQDTIDGSPPTSALGIYYLTKTKQSNVFNQREFHVTDPDQNLLFTTRSVPGTVACFDVLGRGIEDFVLRVNVDLARRYWIVYRYNKPVFDGQQPDEELSNVLAPQSPSLQAPKLFKVCCITVSWSRYMAVSAMYGPPKSLDDSDREDSFEISNEGEKSQDNPLGSLLAGGVKEDGDINSGDDTWYSVDQQKHEQRSHCSNLDTSDRPCSETTLQSDNDSCESEKSFPTNEEDDEVKFIAKAEVGREKKDTESPNEDAEKKLKCASEANDSSALSLSLQPIAKGDSHLLRSDSAPSDDKSSQHQIRKWIRSQSDTLREKSKNFLKASRAKTTADPRMGVLDLDDRPLLVCQEIYTRLVGNHQTSLASKDQVLELLRQDEVEHNKDSQKSSQVDREGKVYDTEEDDPLLSVSREAHIDDGEAAGTTEIIDTANDTNDHDEKKEDRPSESSQESKMKKDIKSDTATGQPLVGYWHWENTLFSQKMKMHVAKNSDLALHVVLSIIVNQVRCERNAIALSL